MVRTTLYIENSMAKKWHTVEKYCVPALSHDLRKDGVGMMIRTYDDKTKATFYLEGLNEYFRSLLELKEQEKRVAVAKAESYNQGYHDALYAVASILGASNYRAEEADK